MTDQTTPAGVPAEQQPAQTVPEPSAEEQHQSLVETQQEGETTSPQAEQQQERDAAEPDPEAAPADANSGVSRDEQATRAAHSAEGGGAWPPELLAERGVVPHNVPDYDALREQQAAEAERQGGEQGQEA